MMNLSVSTPLSLAEYCLHCTCPHDSPPNCQTQNDEFYNNLLAGKSGVTEISSFDASGFSTRFAGEIKVGDCNHNCSTCRHRNCCISSRQLLPPHVCCCVVPAIVPPQLPHTHSTATVWDCAGIAVFVVDSVEC